MSFPDRRGWRHPPRNVISCPPASDMLPLSAAPNATDMPAASGPKSNGRIGSLNSAPRAICTVSKRSPADTNAAAGVSDQCWR